MKRPGHDVNAVVHTMRGHGLVMRELQHRMANTLAILQASCRLEFAAIADPELRESLRRHEVRLLHLAELHHFLSRGAGCAEIEAQDYFQPLCTVLSRSILAPLGLHCEALVGEGVIDGGICEWLGLIVAELVTNAAKHGFPDRLRGRVRVELVPQNEENWCCTVSDNGCGMVNTKRGTGSKILNSLVEMVGGRIAIQTGSSGTTVIVLFPSRPPNPTRAADAD